MSRKLFLSLVISIIQLNPATGYQNVHHLENAEKFTFDSNGGLELQTFCYKGRKKSIIYTWQSVMFHLNHPNDDYTLYEGSSPEDVLLEYSKNRFYWSTSLFPVKQKSFKINPFNSTCIGVKSSARYTVRFNVINIDFWKIILLGIGLFVYLSAGTLSKNTFFHYVTGIAFGICASVLVLIYIISKVIPKKPFMYGVVGMGWTLVIYLWKLLWENIQVILTDYKFYVMWYILFSGFISFVLCYRWGPVENERTINLIKWALQFAGLCSIYNSSDYSEAAMAQIVILLIGYHLPQKWKTAPRTYWKRKFPPKKKLLTNDEYYHQGVVETEKALKSLRDYCSSPDCNQWKTVLKLKDVKRFASFVEGDSHLSDDEVLEYDSFVQEMTDDEEREDMTEEEDEDY
ncbi:nuclear envelope integral membrane protein 1 [Diabrotica virgifera virgifera]|uniref:Nuclear envelope integral membrane protein 1 n=1 Tax=Diabrotica virgifera virgifera TaxID=50390 RepID=A0ABM5IYH2_DIAVI|nr:nuclear envelope integral membrane protein 1 [Diabrotica virgifera virgifera]XP_028149434.2 nuclear envelope integral membrane protein 1 [Diabrotica virgifera virgifera]XP_050499753.1 nuclear envelope integral membrane protein 1 [Diabrotica virgifera virgifera]